MTLHSQPFHDKIALVTGASSGIGRALAAALAKRGARVVLVARNEAKLRAVAQSLPGQHLVAPADVRRPEDVRRVVADTLAKFQRIDTLVNNAGIGQVSSVEQTSMEEFRDVFEVNFFGALEFLHAVAPQMIRQRSGSVIQISSLNGFCAIPLGSAYCASKFALEGLSQSVRIELHKHNVHVLIVRPGITDTKFFDNARNFHERNPFPLRNFMSAEAVAEKTLRAAARRKRELVLTAEGKALWWMYKFSPRLVDRILLHYAGSRPA